MVTDRKTILLADDDSDDAEMFSLVLGEIDASIHVRHVLNGVGVLDSLSKLQSQLPDVIFLDINMPIMNGWQCLTKLKENELWSTIPVIIYSTSSHTKDKQIATELGASAFITKPSDYKELKSLLANIVANVHEPVKLAWK